MTSTNFDPESRLISLVENQRREDFIVACSIFNLPNRLRLLYSEFESEKVLCTSSFGAHSALLLYLISVVKPEQKIYFIDTGNHFKETLEYKEKITEKLGLNVIDITASPEVHNFVTLNETWKTSPEFCCHLKKIKPVDALKKKHAVWMTGLMEWQSDHRATLNYLEKRNGILRFNPLLDLSEENFQYWIEQFDLPRNELVKQGYESIGCTHCTTKGSKRSGRWKGTEKTECGLHL